MKAKAEDLAVACRLAYEVVQIRWSYKSNRNLGDAYSGFVEAQSPGTKTSCDDLASVWNEVIQYRIRSLLPNECDLIYL